MAPGGGIDGHVARPPRPVGGSEWRFPDPAEGDASGLVAFGADLAPETLVCAYRSGLFPWPHPGTPLPWFSPNPRGVLFLDRLRVARSLRQRLRQCGWTTTVDAEFEGVVAACAVREGETWITPDMRAAYRRLHELGWAHSVEVWDDAELVGGLYGVRVGACFTGESMFHRRTDASKVALVDLVDRWREAGGELIDVQIATEHLATLGASEVGRAQFLARLAVLRDKVTSIPVDERPVNRLAR
jgi:leucyl/phenylalanyl-tRNA---protein transferase